MQNKGLNNVLGGKHSDLILMATHQPYMPVNISVSSKVSVMISLYYIF